MNNSPVLTPTQLIELTGSLQMIVPELMLAVGAIMIIAIEALASPPVRRRTEALVALLTVILALLTNVALHVQLAPDDLHFVAFDGLLAIDAGTGILRGIILGTLLVGYLFTWHRQIWTAVRSEFYALSLIAAMGAIIMVEASHLLVLILGLELLSLPLYTFAALRKDSSRSREAGLKYLILGSLASAIMVFGMALIYAGVGSVQYDQLYTARIDSRMYGVGAIMVLTGLLFKGGLLPFYAWSPDVYEGAPDSQVGLMAALAKVGAFGALMQLAGPFFTGLPSALPACLTLVAGATMLLGNLQALAQTNLKRLLAYSSVAHAGYLLLGILAMSSLQTLVLAKSAIYFYMSTYLVTIVAAFGLIAWLQGKEGRWEISDLAGAGQRHPGWATTLTILLFSLAGIPPLAGFFGKAYVFHAAVGAGFINLAVFGVLTSVLSVYYYLRVIVAIWFEPEQAQLSLTEPAPGRLAARAVMVWLLVLGLMPGLIYNMAYRASRWNGQARYFPGPSLPDQQVQEALNAVYAPVVHGLQPSMTPRAGK
ncbi:MAG: NAD(P)H-quinone oxidoreductase subunit 2, chloroplastic [bacterium]|nr:NAD(P)H-quinone oxidoreductase subunit 2, chloroplastic [bacterium]